MVDRYDSINAISYQKVKDSLTGLLIHISSELHY